MDSCTASIKLRTYKLTASPRQTKPKAHHYI